MNVFQNNMKIYFTEYYFQEITNIHFIVLIIIIIMILILIIKKSITISLLKNLFNW